MPSRQARRSAGVVPRLAARLAEKNRARLVDGRSCVQAPQLAVALGPAPPTRFVASPFQAAFPLQAYRVSVKPVSRVCSVRTPWQMCSLITSPHRQANELIRIPAEERSRSSPSDTSRRTVPGASPLDWGVIGPNVSASVQL